MVENDSEMAILDCIASGTLSDVKNFTVNVFVMAFKKWTWTELILSLSLCTSMQKCGIQCADRAPSEIEYNNHSKTQKEEKYWSQKRQFKLLNLQLKG